MENGITDKFGGSYSNDGKSILKAPRELEGDYHIKEGTVCIGDSAFEGCKSLTSIILREIVLRQVQRNTLLND